MNDWYYLRELKAAEAERERLTKEAQASASAKAQQEAINKQLLMKYLPQQLEAQGLGGLGISQSSLLEADIASRNRMNTIKTEEEQRLQDIIAAYTGEKSSAFDKLVAKKDEAQTAAAQQEAQQATNMVNLYLEEFLADEYLSADEEERIKDYIDKFKNIDAGTKRELEDLMEYYKSVYAEGGTKYTSASINQFDDTKYYATQSLENRVGWNTGNGVIRDGTNHSANIQYNGNRIRLQSGEAKQIQDPSLPTFGAKTVYYVKDDKLYLYDGKSRTSYEISKAKNLTQVIGFLKDNGVVAK